MEEETTEEEETKEGEARERETLVTSGRLPSLSRSGPTLFPSTWKRRERKRSKKTRQPTHRRENKRQDGGSSRETLERADSESASK